MKSLADLAASPDAVREAIQSQLPEAEPARYARLVRSLAEDLHADPQAPVCFASAPGRTELAGNHTDHNNGRVLAAAVDLDTIAAVVPRNDRRVRIQSDGFRLTELDLQSLDMVEAERETTSALVRGVAAGLASRGFAVGGFDARVCSRVASGSGLSSSASVEVLAGSILDHLYNGDRAGPTVVAQAGQHAENHFFGKPSGLMDQLACATGGIVAIDFRDASRPHVERLSWSFANAGLSLLVVHSGGSHADLTDEYAAIPADMRAVAAHFDAEVLADVSEESVLGSLAELRRTCGDRAVARSLHFYQENRRVGQMVRALRERDMAAYLAHMADSGRSSGMFLQNCVPACAPNEQAVVVALALTERWFECAGLRFGHEAACRVHGGGFAGTIQVVMPADREADYREFISAHVGEEAVTSLSVRAAGAICWP